MQYSLNYSGTGLLSTENYNYSISCRGFRLKVCKLTPKVNDIGRGLGYKQRSGLSCPHKAMSPIE